MGHEAAGDGRQSAGQGKYQHLKRKGILPEGPAGALVFTDGLQHSTKGRVDHPPGDGKTYERHHRKQGNKAQGSVKRDSPNLGGRDPGDPSLPLRDSPGSQHELEDHHLEPDGKNDEILIPNSQRRKGQEGADNARERTPQPAHKKILPQMYTDQRRGVSADRAENGMAHRDDAHIAHDQVQGLN